VKPRSTRRARSHGLVSAHRFGAGPNRARENTIEALEAALELGVDFVEFDVQRCLDGVFVVSHDSRVLLGDDHRVPISSLTVSQLELLLGHVTRYDDVLTRIAGRARAHIDLKFTSSGGEHEVAAVRRAEAVLGEEHLVVTTLDDDAVRAVRDWSDAEGLEVLVGLSLGRSVRGLPWRRQLGVRLSELLPRVRYRRSRANVVVAKHTLARLGVAWFARRQGLPLLVWTVDTEDSLRYWLRPGRCWLVTTNYPDLAMRVRDGLRGSAP